MSKSWDLYALHILEVIPKLKEIKATGNILKNDILYAATLRHLQTMSESTQKLPEAKKELCPLVPWEKIRGFRNILVHDYLGDINPEIVASIFDKELDILGECVEKLLEEHGNEK